MYMYITYMSSYFAEAYWLSPLQWKKYSGFRFFWLPRKADGEDVLYEVHRNNSTVGMMWIYVSAWQHHLIKKYIFLHLLGKVVHYKYFIYVDWAGVFNCCLSLLFKFIPATYQLGIVLRRKFWVYRKGCTW